jgi:hypothetical protein
VGFGPLLRLIYVSHAAVSGSERPGRRDRVRRASLERTK